MQHVSGNAKGDEKNEKEKAAKQVSVRFLQVPTTGTKFTSKAISKPSNIGLKHEVDEVVKAFPAASKDVHQGKQSVCKEGINEQHLDEVSEKAKENSKQENNNQHSTLNTD